MLLVNALWRHGALHHLMVAPKAPRLPNYFYSTPQKSATIGKSYPCRMGFFSFSPLS